MNYFAKYQASLGGKNGEKRSMRLNERKIGISTAKKLTKLPTIPVQ